MIYLKLHFEIKILILFASGRLQLDSHVYVLIELNVFISMKAIYIVIYLYWQKPLLEDLNFIQARYDLNKENIKDNEMSLLNNIHIYSQAQAKICVKHNSRGC